MLFSLRPAIDLASHLKAKGQLDGGIAVPGGEVGELPVRAMSESVPEFAYLPPLRVFCEDAGVLPLYCFDAVGVGGVVVVE